MSKLKYNGNEIIHNNLVSYFYEVETIDLDHFYLSEKKLYWINLNRTLNQLKNDEYFIKVYKINNKIFIQTPIKDIQIEGWKLHPRSNLYRCLLGQNDIYSEPIFQEDCVLINGEYYRFISLYDFPTGLHFNQISSLDNLYLNFQKIPTEVSKAKAKKASRKHEANISAKQTIQIESQKAADETLSIYSDLIEGITSLFKAQVWTFVKASSREKLNVKTKEVTDFLQRIDATPLIETYATKTILKSFLPTNFISFTRSHDTPTDYLTCLLPYNGDEVHESGVMFNSTLGNRIFIDIFNNKLSNYNAIISGKSGSGKSMCGQKIVSDLIETGEIKAVILDKGYSFEKITSFHNGNHFSNKFNPLQFLDPIYLKEFVVSVISEEELNRKTKGEISEAIDKFLLSKKAKNFANFLNQMEEIIPDIKLYFADVIPYITDEDIEIKNITYVDTTLYPKSVISPLIIYLIEYFKNIKGKKIFVFDECWEFMKNNTDYIEECYRTFRKFDGSAIAITQSISDFLSNNNRIGEIVFNNTCHKFFFKQDRIPGGLIHEEDSEIITTLETRQGEFSEFLYKDEFLRKTCRFYPTPLEYELFTSKRAENDLIQNFLNNNKDIGFRNAIMKWTDLKYEGYLQ